MNLRHHVSHLVGRKFSLNVAVIEVGRVSSVYMHNLRAYHASMSNDAPQLSLYIAVQRGGTSYFIRVQLLRDWLFQPGMAPPLWGTDAKFKGEDRAFRHPSGIHPWPCVR